MPVEMFALLCGLCMGALSVNVEICLGEGGRTYYKSPESQKRIWR